MCQTKSVVSTKSIKSLSRLEPVHLFYRDPATMRSGFNVCKKIFNSNPRTCRSFRFENRAVFLYRTLVAIYVICFLSAGWSHLRSRAIRFDCVCAQIRLKPWALYQTEKSPRRFSPIRLPLTFCFFLSLLIHFCRWLVFLRAACEWLCGVCAECCTRSPLVYLWTFAINAVGICEKCGWSPNRIFHHHICNAVWFGHGRLNAPRSR